MTNNYTYYRWKRRTNDRSRGTMTESRNNDGSSNMFENTKDTVTWSNKTDTSWEASKITVRIEQLNSQSLLAPSWKHFHFHHTPYQTHLTFFHLQCCHLTNHSFGQPGSVPLTYTSTGRVRNIWTTQPYKFIRPLVAFGWIFGKELDLEGNGFVFWMLICPQNWMAEGYLQMGTYP